MPEPTANLFPLVATARQIRDHMEWLVQTGRGDYRVEIRERYIALPPTKEACDDHEKVAFLRGVM